MAKITKKHKRIALWTAIIIAILLLLVQCTKTPEPTTGSSGGLLSVFSGGGGGGGGSTPAASAPATESTSFISFFSRLYIPTPECTRNSDCNKCANANYDTCVDGSCKCVAPEQFIDATRSTPLTATPECSRNTDCNKCANPAYDACVDGACGCIAPVPAPTCTDTDVSLLRSPDGKNYVTKGSCSDSTETIIANDYCSGTMLTEYYCGATTTCDAVTINCETQYGRGYFCYDGSCTTLA